MKSLTLVFLQLVRTTADVAALVLKFREGFDLSSIWGIDAADRASGELHSPGGLVKHLRLEVSNAALSVASRCNIVPDRTSRTWCDGSRGVRPCGVRLHCGRPGAGSDNSGPSALLSATYLDNNALSELCVHFDYSRRLCRSLLATNARNRQRAVGHQHSSVPLPRRLRLRNTTLRTTPSQWSLMARRRRSLLDCNFGGQQESQDEQDGCPGGRVRGRCGVGGDRRGTGSQGTCSGRCVVCRS